MFCKKCGKQLDYEGDICLECQQAQSPAPAQPAEAPAYEVPAYTAPVYEAPVAPQATMQAAPVANAGDKKTGFKPALTATILAGISFLFTVTIAMMMTGGMDMQLIREAFSGDRDVIAILITSYGVTYMMFAVAEIALCIPAIVKGAQSIACFVKESKANRIKPVVTLVLGIVAIALAAIAIIMALSSFSGSSYRIQYGMSLI